jgi:molybdopterin-guanine dinucleotide biosynthesis protein A
VISIAIQAGGRSSRMGSDKALLPIGGKRLIEHVIDRVQPFSDDLFITTNQPEGLRDLGLRLVGDETPGQGALYGLKTAFQAARHENVLVVACDMPLIQPALIRHMFSFVNQVDVIVPEKQGKLEPLLAIYYVPNCLPALEQALRQLQQRMISFFPDVEILTIPEGRLSQFDPDGLCFVNVNTPEDALRVEQLLAEQANSDIKTTE